MEAAADLIAHPAHRHRLQRGERHVARPPIAPERRGLKQEVQLRRARELRRAAESAVPPVERLREARDAGVDRLRAGHGRRSRRSVRTAGLAEPRDELRRRLAHPRPLVPPGARELLQHLDETRPPPPRRRRKVGAAVERLAVRRQPHAHRPPAGAGRGLDEHHVHAVDVRPLLAVELDGDEIAVEHVRDAPVLERLVRHDVAPVARRVADREEDRLVLAPRCRERLVAPRIPVHRIVGVLQQIGTALARQPVRHHPHPIRYARGALRVRGPPVLGTVHSGHRP